MVFSFNDECQSVSMTAVSHEQRINRIWVMYQHPGVGVLPGFGMAGRNGGPRKAPFPDEARCQ